MFRNNLIHEKIGFLKTLDALTDYHNSTRTALQKAESLMTIQAVIPVVKKPNAFVSFLSKIGHAFKAGFPEALQIAATAGETAVAIFAPAASPLFNQTIGALYTAEHNYPAQGTGAQKSQAVIGIMGGLIKQGLTDAGLPNDDAGIQKYIDAALLISKVTLIPVAEAPLPVAVLPVLPAVGGGTGGPIQVPVPAGDSNAEVQALPKAGPQVVPAKGPAVLGLL